MLKIKATYELPEVTGVGPDSDLRFVIEISEDCESGQFFARLYRRELFRVTPSSSASDESDEEILVEDSFWRPESRSFSSEEDALTAVLSRLADQLDSEVLRGELAMLRQPLE